MVRKETLAILIFAMAVLAIWAWYEFRPVPVPGAAPPPPPPAKGVNRLADVTVLQRNWSVLDELTWNDLNATAAAFAGQELLRRRFLEETAESPHPPTIYLRGLIALANDDPQQAAKDFSRLTPEELPTALLYAPWRVLAGVRPGEENPFAAPLLRAAEADEIAPLLAARVFAFEAAPTKALQAYLASDPGQWAELDLEAFRLLLLDEAARNDAGNLLLAAFRGGRLPEALRPQVARLLLQGAQAAAVGPQLKDFLASNPEVRAVADEVLISLLEDRKLFMEEKYADFLAKHRSSETGGLIDETVILLVLAAAADPQGEDFSRWAQELSRRFPQPEVTAWLESLRTANH